MNTLVAIAGLFLLVVHAGPIAQPEGPDAFLARWKNETHQKLVRGAFWTLMHSDADGKRVEVVLRPVQPFLEALERGDRSALTPGAIQAFKDSLSGLLDDEEQAVRALAAVLLGVCGDKAYASQLARLLAPRSVHGDLPRFDRGRAAIALGLVGATEYARDLGNLLQSANLFDRSGAAFGLGALRAREYEGAIEKLLNDAEGDVSEMAKEALAMMRGKPR